VGNSLQFCMLSIGNRMQLTAAFHFNVYKYAFHNTCQSIIHHNRWQFFLNLPFHIVWGTGYHKNHDNRENTGYFTSPNWKEIYPEKIMHTTSILVPTGQETALFFWKQYSFVSHVDADVHLIFFSDQPWMSSLYHLHFQRRKCKTIIQHARQ